MSRVIKKGPWTEERNIGSGGFGAVTLWKNEETGDLIALKKCRLVNEMTEKHKHRWQLEVTIMRRLEHENLISALEVPKELEGRSNELPMLAMEYCSGGDLRRVLNQPENSCGLKEYSVRCIVRDISAGLEYLHSKKIIHRDIKPENIVLKPVDGEVVYKIIDLGYAKDLEQGSVCTSFVGTLQYLAPELFASSKYTCTVDYWSFGTVVFECITGHRPFLPNSPPVHWHAQVNKKSPDDICVKEVNGEVKFYKTIESTNRLSRSMQTYLEQWLRMMLRWDPKARGGGLTSTGRPTCFQVLDTVLNMKIIYLLHVATNELLTYPVIEAHTMLDLQKRIEEETKIPIAEQDIVMANGMSPSPNQPASQCWMEPHEQDCFVYLFRCGVEDFFPEQSPERRVTKKIPPAVQSICIETKIMLPFAEQKKAWAESVVFCEEQYTEYRRIILSQRAAMLSLLRGDTHFVNMKNTMITEVNNMMTKVNYFKESVEHDMMFYNEQVTNGGVSADRMYSTWLKKRDEVMGFQAMQNKVTELEQHANALQTKIVELQKSPFAKAKQDDMMEELAKSAKNTYQEFRQNAKDKGVIKDQQPIVSCVVKSIMWRQKKLPDLFAHLGKICACKTGMNDLLPQVQACLEEIRANSKKIVEYQKQRQTAVWKLVEIAVEQGKRKVANENPGIDNVDIPTLCRQDLSNSQRSDMSGSGRSMAAGASMAMQSFLGPPTTMESMRAVENSKALNKQMNDALGEFIADHETLSRRLSDLTLSLSDSSL